MVFRVLQWYGHSGKRKMAGSANFQGFSGQRGLIIQLAVRKLVADEAVEELSL